MNDRTSKPLADMTLPERLREFGETGRMEGGLFTMSRAFMTQAADEIERLTAQREAEILQWDNYHAQLMELQAERDRLRESLGLRNADDLLALYAERARLRAALELIAGRDLMAGFERAAYVAREALAGAAGTSTASHTGFCNPAQGLVTGGPPDETDAGRWGSAPVTERCHSHGTWYHWPEAIKPMCPKCAAENGDGC